MLNIFHIFFGKMSIPVFCLLLDEFFFLIILTLMSSLYILETNPFSDGFDITFSHSVDYLFICGWLPWLCKRKHSRVVCMHPVALMGDLDME